MYYPIAKNLYVSGTAYSPVFAMDGNALQLAVVVSVKTGSGTLTVSIEGSNDQVNWSTTGITGSAFTITDSNVGLGSGLFSTIAYAFFRVKFVMAANAAILNADGNSATL